MSGLNFAPVGLNAALASATENDTLVVWRLDRLGRSLSKLVDLVSYLGRRNIEFVLLSKSISTNSSGGILMFHMTGALAQFERSLISERTKAGIAAARERGVTPGRKRSLTLAQRVSALAMLVDKSAAQSARYSTCILAPCSAL